LFHCQAVLDPKVIEATVHWMSNHTKLKGEKLTGKHNIGIRVRKLLHIEIKVFV